MNGLRRVVGLMLLALATGCAEVEVQKAPAPAVAAPASPGVEIAPRAERAQDARPPASGADRARRAAEAAPAQRAEAGRSDAARSDARRAESARAEAPAAPAPPVARSRTARPDPAPAGEVAPRASDEESRTRSATVAGLPATRGPADRPVTRSADIATAITVFYATDRRRNPTADPDEVFGTRRGELTYGTCEVSVPREHRIGELETPLLGMRMLQNPRRHIILLDVDPMEPTAFFTALSERLRRSSGKNAFLFVHGYNVTFADAARRTAQIYYDLKFDGVPVFYSWPSQEKLTLTAYRADEAAIEATKANLRRLIEDVVDRTGAENVYLIAHSLGTRALSSALIGLAADRPAIAGRIREVILTAPDIDARVFTRDIAPKLAAASRGVTLYASAQDKALATSRTFNNYPLAGDTGEGLVLIPGIETIDATGVDTTFLGHSYYAESRSVLSDIYYLVREGKRAESRFGLEAVRTTIGTYWRFRR